MVRYSLLLICLGLTAVAVRPLPSPAAEPASQFVDHSLLVATDYPCTWPAPGPDAILYLKSRGIRCVATDAPDLGGVEPRRAAMTYWALGSRDMVGVEFLCNLNSIPTDSDPYFLFAALKIRDCHGGPGRAIVLY